MRPMILALLLLCSSPLSALEVIALDSKSPLVQVKVMVKAGSAQDPAGREGLAALTASLLISGGFGDPASPVTKERLAELTRPWGSGAFPSESATKEVTVFSFEVPREVFPRFVDEVLAPMLTRPLFEAKELDRLRGETLQALGSSLRLEHVEDFGLIALDNLIYNNTPYAHPDAGTLQGLKELTREDVVAFYKGWYRPQNIIVGLSASDPALSAKVRSAVEGFAAVREGQAAGAWGAARITGRKAVIISLPNAISSGLHAGFPIAVTRKHPDFWPLYLGNVWFGTHRDGFSHLYQVLREERGYNYGDYSYIEHFEGRPSHLFPPFNTPRLRQYFSIWVRPVGHAYVPHVMRAITWELEDLLRQGLSDTQCAEAKVKAKVLYLSLAESAERLLASRLDDAFYGSEPGYLASYLQSIDVVKCSDVNAALRRHLKPELLQYLVVTNAAEAQKIAAGAAALTPVYGKDPGEYQIDVKQEDGKKLYLVPEGKLDVLRRDAVWAREPLNLRAEDIRIVPVEQVFETPAL